MVTLDLYEQVAGYEDSTWPSNSSTASDLVRYLVLHNYGGFWFDLDLIVMRDLTPLLHYELAYPWGKNNAAEAAVLGGVDDIHIAPGSKVLYLGAASGTSVSHVSDIVGEGGCVYAVEFSHRSGRDLINVAKKRTNIIPIIEDARHPTKYRMLIGMVDCVFADVAQPDQARIVALNSHLFLKNGGHTVISIKANCIDSTAPAEAVFAKLEGVLDSPHYSPDGSSVRCFGCAQCVPKKKTTVTAVVAVAMEAVASSGGGNRVNNTASNTTSSSIIVVLTKFSPVDLVRVLNPESSRPPR